MSRIPTVYILASYRQGTLYVGVTGNPTQRIWQHNEGLTEGFTKQYRVTKLVHFETYPTMPEAIQREKQIKKWNREWKIKLIEKENPDWKDLWPQLTQGC